MDKPLSQETQSKIRALCESIAHREQLGEDVHEELRGHIEDKISAYITGNLPVSEDDALMLATQHFGKPGTIKSLLQCAHPYRAALSMGRRLSIAAVVTLAAWLVSKTITLLIALPGALFLPPSMLHIWLSVASGIAGLVSCAVLIQILRMLSREPRSNHLQRLAAWRTKQFVFAFAMLVIIEALVPAVGYAFQPANSVREAAPDILQGGALYVVLVLQYSVSTFIMLATLLAWLWWCDQPPRVARTLGTAAAVWVIFTVVHQVVSRFTGLIAVHFSAQPFESGLELGVGSGGAFATLRFNHVFASYYSLSDAATTAMQGTSFFWLVTWALTGYVLYRLVLQKFKTNQSSVA